MITITTEATMIRHQGAAWGGGGGKCVRVYRYTTGKQSALP
jgi:hypothetical protein